MSSITFDGLTHGLNVWVHRMNGVFTLVWTVVKYSSAESITAIRLARRALPEMRGTRESVLCGRRLRRTNGALHLPRVWARVAGRAGVARRAIPSFGEEGVNSR